MNHIRGTNRWSCLASSFAMALGVTAEQIIQMVGHDGSEIVWPELAEPQCRRGFHIQEMIYVAFELDFAITPFEAHPVAIGGLGARPFVVPMRLSSAERVPALMRGRSGVLTGENERGSGHAVAWDGDMIYDPARQSPSRETDFIMETFWCVRKIKST